MRKHKKKLLGILLGSFILSFPSFENEAYAFAFTAPTVAVVKISCQFLAQRFEPSRE